MTGGPETQNDEKTTPLTDLCFRAHRLSASCEFAVTVGLIPSDSQSDLQLRATATTGSVTRTYVQQFPLSALETVQPSQLLARFCCEARAALRNSAALSTAQESGVLLMENVE